MFANGLTICDWMSRNYHHENWLSGSPTQNTTSCPKPVFTGCSGRTTSSLVRLLWSSRLRMSSATRQWRSTRCGKPTSPTSKSSPSHRCQQRLPGKSWGWYYLSTVLDDFSRYVAAWKLCTTMKKSDVTDTLELALQASGCDQVTVRHKPRLLSDNGASYVSGELADWLSNEGMDHVRGAPYHPQTQGKIKRWHQTLKNWVLPENYFRPGDLNANIERFVERHCLRGYVIRRPSVMKWIN